jgi:hypothetical protein
MAAAAALKIPIARLGSVCKAARVISDSLRTRAQALAGDASRRAKRPWRPRAAFHPHIGYGDIVTATMLGRIGAVSS